MNFVTSQFKSFVEQKIFTQRNLEEFEASLIIKLQPFLKDNGIVPFPEKLDKSASATINNTSALSKKRGSTAGANIGKRNRLFGLQQSLPTISPTELNKTLGSKFSQR